MTPEKNDSLALKKNKSVAIKRRVAETKSESSGETPLPPKKSKLAVRITGRDLKIKEKSETSEGQKNENKIEEKGGGEHAVHHKDGRESKEKKEVSAHHAKPAGKKKSENQSHPVGLYKKLFIFFIILTLLLLGAAFYFFFVTLTVVVTPKTERISDRLNLIISNKEPEPNAVNLSGQETINGLVEQINVKVEKTYAPTGAEILSQEITGKVSIINNYTQGKTLVATTRLLSPAGKLFRIKDKVEIPAGQTREVEIYTDEPSQDMAIGPTEFTIPGLWAGLQDKIYAKSSQSFTYTTQVKKFIQAIDLEKAAQDLKDDLVKKVSDQFGENYKGFDKIITEIDKDSLQSSSTAKAKEQVDSFRVALSAKANIVGFKYSDLNKLVANKLALLVAKDEEAVNPEQNKTEYNLVSADFSTGLATLEVPFTGTTRLSNANSVIDKEDLIGLSKAQIEKYLAGLNKFSDIKLIFMPPFINKAPSLVDRIKVVIE